MRKRGFMKRAISAIALGPGPGYKSVEQIDAMPAHEKAKYVINDLPSLTRLFSDFGNPSLWPLYARHGAEQQQGLSDVFDGWMNGHYNDVEGVAMPPVPPLTVMR